jgi:uncharacterized protein (TIGR03435 family)
MLRIARNFFAMGVAGLLATASCCVAQTPSAATPRAAFEVASVKPAPPDRRSSTLTIPEGTQITETGISLAILIQLAFGLEQNQMSGPDWIKSQTYDIAAKTEGEVSLTKEQMMPLLQQLLSERFKLTFHRETKALPGYALVVAKGGSKLQAAKEGASKGGYLLRDGIRVPSATTKTLAAMLAVSLKQPVIDKTGIAGDYEIKMSFAPEDASDATLPSIFTAVQEQLGLKLEAQKVPMEMLVVDHVERTPTEN